MLADSRQNEIAIASRMEKKVKKNSFDVIKSEKENRFKLEYL